MLAKKERIMDGIHCDLCGCTSPAVRCDKCNSQIFCLSCDDMYHRHPKRRLHLRKAVDSITSNTVRSVTPNKPPPGDPSKMPIPPPRKKKPRNFFGTLRRGSPIDEGPSLPKKEFSWSDKFGTIKRFMSNRPLPPLPVESSPSPEPAFSVGTIYQNVPDKSENTSSLQSRMPVQHQNSNPSFVNSNGLHLVNGDVASHNSTEGNSESDERPLPPPKQYHLLQEMDAGNDRHWGAQRTRGSSLGEVGKWGLKAGIHQGTPMPPPIYPYGNKQEMNHPNMMPGYATFRKPSQHQSPHQRNMGSRSPSPSPKEQSSSMHPSTSLTDLHSLPTTPGPYPYPYPPHPHQPFLPMFPAHSYAHLNCPQCYANSWPEPSDNCEYCQSGDDSSHQKHVRHPPANRVKRSQSVMYDSMNNPVPYFPFPPGYGPFYPHGPHFETPPSPASSTRSLRNSGRLRKRHTTEDNTSVVSSAHSRGKSTSSGQLKSPENESMEISSDEDTDNRQRQNLRKSPAADTDYRQRQNLRKSPVAMEVECDSVPSPEENSVKSQIPAKPWSCEFCTFINPAGVRICNVCCKTVSSASATSDQSPQQKQNCDEVLDHITSNNPTSETSQNNVPLLTSALAEAEKELNIEFDKLMKLNENDANYKEITNNRNNAIPSSHFVETSTSPIHSSPELSHKTQLQNGELENTQFPAVSDNKKEVKQVESTTTATNNNHQFNLKLRKDSSCQTYNDISEIFLERTDNHFLDSPSTTVKNEYSKERTVSLGTSPLNFHSTEVGTSPPSYNHDLQSNRTNVAGMRRSLSRLSLNYGPRPSESRQQYQNQDWLGYGIGEPLYRSISHSSLISEPDVWSHDARNFRKPEYYLSIEELVERRRQEAMRAQGLELVRMIREAEQKGFTADDLQVALNNCGKLNPVEWLENNWKNMVETVVTLATNYGHDKRENDIGILSSSEAREALRLHKGNIWAAVTECVESRQRKYLELSARGSFTHKEIVAALTANQGNVELAYTELTKASLKPFLMRIWGPGSGVENESATIPQFLSSEKKQDQRQQLNEAYASETKFKNKSYEEDSESYLENNYQWTDDRSDILSIDYEYDRSNEDNSIYDNRDNVITTPDRDFTYISPLDPNEELPFRAKIDIKEKRVELKDETKKKRSGFLSRLTALKKSSKDGGKKEASEKKLNENSKVHSQNISKIELYENNINKTGFQETDNSYVIKETMALAAQNLNDSFSESSIPHENSQIYKEESTLSERLQDDKSPKPQVALSAKHKTEKKHGLVNVFKSLSLDKSKTESVHLVSKGKSKTVGSSDNDVSSIDRLPVLPFSGQNDKNKETMERKLHNIPNKESDIIDKNSNESSLSPINTAGIQNDADFKKEHFINIPSSSSQTVSLFSLNGNVSAADKNGTPLINSNEPEMNLVQDMSTGIIKQDSQENDRKEEITPSESLSENEHIDGKVSSDQKDFYIEQDKNKLQNKNTNNSSGGAIPKSISKKSPLNNNASDNKESNKFKFTGSKQLANAKKDSEIAKSSKKSEITLIQKKFTERTGSESLNQMVGLEKTNDKIDNTNDALSNEESIKLNNENKKTNTKVEERKTNAKTGVTKPSGKESNTKSNFSKKEMSNSPLMGMKNLLAKSSEKQETKTLTENTKKITLKKDMSTSVTLLKRKEDSLGKKRNWMSPMQKANEKQLAFERKVRRYLAEERCSTYEKAEIAVQLVEMEFNEDDVLQAMQECTTLEQALCYLQQDCELCVGVYPANKMVAMFHCPHRACTDCLKTYFTIQIRDRNIRELMCPYCNEPDIDNEDTAMDYFNHLDIMLKKLVDPDIHELFQQKLRDRVLMKDPSFRWCSQCSSGFIGNPDLFKVACPDCKAVTCAKCRRLWEKQHDGISCEQFGAWKDANDPEAQAAGLAKHLTDNGIDCPNCKFRYSLAKGGCMHFRCTQCQYDFCSGCGKPFKMGQKCTVSEFCVKLGLHAHHPRNCLFYLRDKDPEDLQMLLEENNIDYDTEPSEGMDIRDECQVMEQKETPQGMRDDICGKEVNDGYAGLCRLHFIEYLVGLINEHLIDPLPILDLQDLQLVLRRAQYPVPEQGNKETEEHYRDTLMKNIEENVPLEKQDDS